MGVLFLYFLYFSFLVLILEGSGGYVDHFLPSDEWYSDEGRGRFWKTRGFWSCSFGG